MQPPVPRISRTENLSRPAKNSPSSYKWIVAVLAVVILILIFLPSKTTPDKTSADISTVSASPTAPGATEIVNANFDFIRPEDWTLTQRAVGSISRLAVGQTLELGVVADPLNDKIVYFATSLISPNKKENLISFYNYNTSDFTWHRLFRQSYGPGDVEQLPKDAVPVFRVAGWENGRLIFSVHAQNENIPPCFEPLLPPAVLLSMEIVQPYQKFETFTPSLNLIETLTARRIKCEQSAP